MGVTIQLALITWFASSFLEWRMGRKSEAVHKILINPFFGVIFSFLLGALIGSTAGAGVGVGVFVGNMLGIATNELTYNFFESMHGMITWTKAKTAKVKETKAKIDQFKADHPNTFNEAVQTIKLGFKAIGAICMGIVFLVGLPFRIYQHVQNGINRIRGVAA